MPARSCHHLNLWVTGTPQTWHVHHQQRCASLATYNKQQVSPSEVVAAPRAEFCSTGGHDLRRVGYIGYSHFLGPAFNSEIVLDNVRGIGHFLHVS
jgi:hypothetical protein